MERINWNDQYCLKVFDLDDNHMKVVDLINNIVDLKSTNKPDNNELIEIFNNFSEFVKSYFLHEESYLIKYKYPELNEHRKEHKKFLNKINVFRREFSEDPNNFSENVVDYLTSWTKFHILEYDMKFAPFIRINMFLNDNNKSGNQ